MPIPKRMVGEATKNWPETTPETLADKFQALIKGARERGYELESWQLARVTHPGAKDPVQAVAVSPKPVINECIIAVFVEREIKP